MKKILILCAHPHYSESIANRRLLTAANELEGVESILLEHALEPTDYYVAPIRRADIIVFQFPMYYGSAPWILKKWTDEVFPSLFTQPGLKGKSLLVASTAGAPLSSFTPEGNNLYDVDTLFSPFHLQAHFSEMKWLPPFVVYDLASENQQQLLERAVADYKELLISLQHS